MNKIILSALLALTLTTSAAVAKPAIIIDGDTIRIDGETIRILAIDTPETYKSRCENELVLGLKAKERLRALLDSGPVTFVRDGLDRYQRTLATVYAGKVNVGYALLQEGHALPYKPGGENKLARLRVWCGQNAKLSDTWRRGK